MQAASLRITATEKPEAADPMAVRFGPLPFSAMRRVRVVLTDTPRRTSAIAKACGSTVERTSSVLTKLVRAGLAMKVGAGYVRRGLAMPVLQDQAVPVEIGRQILLCLTEPRRAKDIARIIGRPSCNATGQLQHLLRRGLVVRVSKGVYDLARPDLAGKPTVRSPTSPGRQRQAEHRQRLVGTGLVQVAAWVPDGHQASILALARRLRMEAGVLLPSELPLSIRAAQAARGT